MGMTVGELRQRMSAAELQSWIAYSRVEPIGEYRGDLRAGVIASTIANVNRGKNSPVKSPKDFMLIQNDQETKIKESDPSILAKELISHFTAHNKRTSKTESAPETKTL